MVRSFANDLRIQERAKYLEESRESNKKKKI